MILLSMRSCTAFLFGLSALCLVVTVLGEEVNPIPVDCAWSRWSEWTPCEPCTKTRRRSRGVDVFGQFQGLPCNGALGFEESCDTSAVCQTVPDPPCSSTEFQCSPGSCIKMRLKCNGDEDCENGIDEDCDEITRKPCGGNDLMNNEQGRTAGYGINILGSSPRMNPFNNDMFNGHCARLRNPTTLQNDRLPWNVGVLHYETLAEESVSREIFEDTHSLLREILQENTLTVGGSLSFKFSPTENCKSCGNFSGGAGLEAEYEKANVIKTVSEYSSTQRKNFIRVKGKLQLSTYRMRSQELKVGEDFLALVKTLPLEYEKGAYFAFLEDYGTHYTRNGRSGGEYELIYVLNEDILKEKQFTSNMVKNCVKVGVSADLSSNFGLDGSAGIKPDHCKTLTTSITGDDNQKRMVDQVMTSAKGGSLETVAAMRAQLNKDGIMDIVTFREWARSVADNPALLSSEPEPIFTLIPLSIPGANTRRALLQRAVEDYVEEYNVCKCKPCMNGGTVALLDGKCICLCPSMFEGLACQKVKDSKIPDSGIAAAVHEGNWSCWSGWSTCSEGKRTRSRGCNTDGLNSATCKGLSKSDSYC